MSDYYGTFLLAAILFAWIGYRAYRIEERLPSDAPSLVGIILLAIVGVFTFGVLAVMGLADN